jgi:peptide/nickel transport system ATP-binding protein
MYAGQTLETAPIERFVRHPMVPYTRLLLESLPSRNAALQGIAGDVPSLVSPPSGCRFHPRCPQASGLCRSDHPTASEPEEGHLVRCHHPQMMPMAAAV